VKVRDDIVFREEDDGAFLFDPDNGRLCYLNPIGIDIWKLCRQPIAEEAIINALFESYSGVTQEQIASDCASFLNELERMGFLEHPEEV
jgi:hypothetical protein